MVLALAAVALVLSVSAGAVYAYLKMTADQATDNLTVAEDYAVVLEDWSIMVGATPVPDDGYSVYVRAVANAMWKDSNGHVVEGTPAGCNSTKVLNTTGGWFLGSDGYYYYNAIVPPGGQTTEIFGNDTNHSIKVLLDKDLPDGYKVEVDVIADTVQAVATDSSKWKASDYTTDEVSKVWNYVPSFSVVGIEDTQQGVAITSWSSNTP